MFELQPLLWVCQTVLERASKPHSQCERGGGLALQPAAVTAFSDRMKQAEGIDGGSAVDSGLTCAVSFSSSYWESMPGSALILSGG